MTYETYFDNIRTNYKKLNRKELLDMLVKMLRLYKEHVLKMESEIRKIRDELPVVDEANKEVNRKDDHAISAIFQKQKTEFGYLDSGCFEMSLKAIDATKRLRIYDKARAVLFFARQYPGWHPVSAIPPDIANDVINMIDMNHDIIYDEEYTNYGYM